MMLDFLGDSEVAGRITRAVASFTAADRTSVANLSTSEVGDAIAAHVAAEKAERV